MPRFVLAAAAFVAAVGFSFADEAADKALKALEGNYSLKLMEEDGKPAKDAADAVEGVEIKGDVLTIKLKGGKSEPAKLVLDPSKSPGWIELTPETKGEKKSMKGIYKFEKGELTIVIAETGERPKEFKSTGKDTMMIVFTKKDK